MHAILITGLAAVSPSVRIETNIDVILIESPADWRSHLCV